jgi:hypothetical protein
MGRLLYAHIYHMRPVGDMRCSGRKTQEQWISFHRSTVPSHLQGMEAAHLGMGGASDSIE